MAVVDHLVYAVSDLDEGRRWFEDRTGVTPAPGGSHPGLGTHNALASFGSSYLELIAPDPQQAAPAGPRPFALDDLVLPGLAAFAVRPEPGESIDDLVVLASAAGHDPGAPLSMSRRSPDGTELSWRLTLPRPDAGGVVPFLIDWGDTANPSSTAPAGLALIELTVRHPDPGALRPAFDALGLDADVTLEHHETPGLSATIHSTPADVVLAPAPSLSRPGSHPHRELTDPPMGL